MDKQRILIIGSVATTTGLFLLLSVVGALVNRTLGIAPVICTMLIVGFVCGFRICTVWVERTIHVLRESDRLDPFIEADIYNNVISILTRYTKQTALEHFEGVLEEANARAETATRLACEHPQAKQEG